MSALQSYIFFFVFQRCRASNSVTLAPNPAHFYGPGNQAADVGGGG